MKAKLLLTTTLVLVCAAASFAQKNPIAKSTPTPDAQAVRSSPAYAELLLQKTELQSSVDALLVDHTEEFPKVKEMRSQLGFLQAEMDRLLAVKPENAGRLSDALGKLILRKVELESALVSLRSQYKEDHPEVKRMQRKIDSYEAAIKEILG
jgi:uncharacterized protein involved in exopolysaccharide biosynthesis